MIRILFNTICLLSILSACNESPSAQSVGRSNDNYKVKIVDYPKPGASEFTKYLPLLHEKKVGLVVNKSSQVNGSHLVDALISEKVQITTIFAPEHGFRGDADAGQKVDSETDVKTGLPIYSLYGKNKKPPSQQLSNVDVIVFDLQDVGVRFYTYLSTLHYVMEAAAENDIPVIILDRPNPNGFYTAGPVLEVAHQSFVGLHPVPIVTGLTIGEYGMMINGEGWLDHQITCDLTVVQCPTYRHNQTFELPIAPSPNLPNHRSVLLYPSLCLFEGTTVSVGRGTSAPFQQIGHPELQEMEHHFVPKSSYGSKYPKHENVYCFGIDFTEVPIDTIISNTLDLSYLIQFSEECQKSHTPFFNPNNFFEKLAGTITVRNSLMKNIPLHQLQESWQTELEGFIEAKKKYLLYE